ncbi:HVA22-like protein e [Rosa rugosa]|uniref:HVA22-like protein e n=1 Tax=Rosa rugosa TaxID=74645 RepID=UPI002B40F26D|nr:HVA22-like protein e [Rosa rugosa]
MGKGWTFLTQLHSLAGPVLQLLYPLYASVMAIESPSKLDDEQWLAYWIIYSFLTLLEMVIQPALEWLPIWYEVKLVFVAWLVLPQFKGAAFLYDKYVREQILRYREGKDHHDSSSKSPTGKGKSKFVQFMTPKSGEQEAY